MPHFFIQIQNPIGSVKKIKTILPYAFHLIKPVKNLTEFQVFLYLLT